MAAGGTDEEGKRKYRLLDIFGDWCDQVTDLIRWVLTSVPDTHSTVTDAREPAWQPSPCSMQQWAPCCLLMISCTAAQLPSDALAGSSHIKRSLSACCVSVQPRHPALSCRPLCTAGLGPAALRSTAVQC